MPFTWTPDYTMEQAERAIIEEAMKFTQGNKSAVARILNMAPRTIDNKLEKYVADDADKTKSNSEWETKRMAEVNKLRGNFQRDAKTGAMVLYPDGYKPEDTEKVEGVSVTPENANPHLAPRPAVSNKIRNIFSKKKKVL